MTKYWLKELWRATGIIFVCLLFGLVTERIGTFLIAGGLFFLGWHLLKLHYFASWLIFGRQPDSHLANDIWGDLYYQVHTLRTRNRRRQRKLKDLVSRYQASAAALPDATVVIRDGGTIDWMNEAAAKNLGLSVSTDMGQRIDNLIRHPDFVGYLHSGDYDEPIEIASPADRDKVIQVHIVPYGDQQHLIVARDITKLHKLEVIRRDFVANVSHELSTPLTVISGYLESLAGSRRSKEQLEQVIGQMQQQTERMRNLINDLLQISRLELNEGHREEADVNVPAMVKGLIDDANILNRQREHRILSEIDEDLWLRGGSRDLYSAFVNLLRNAVQYTPDGGEILVRWYADDKGAHFEVRDTGIGIPPQAISRLTERFYRVDTGRSRSVGGTGLGLSIVKHVLRGHDAQLRIESTMGEGSSFCCDFPPGRMVMRAEKRQAL